MLDFWSTFYRQESGKVDFLKTKRDAETSSTTRLLMF